MFHPMARGAHRLVLPPKGYETMKYLHWSEEYNTGVQTIDNDHKDLFSLVNALQKEMESHTPAKNIDKILAALGRYVEKHFKHEEEIMKAYNYPGFAAHKAAHRELALDVHALHKAHVSHPSEVDEEKLLKFLRNWLSNHILRSDMDYVPYIRNKSTSEIENTPIPEDIGSAVTSDGLETVDVSVRVPQESVAALRRCAVLLNAHGEEAATFTELVMSAKTLTLEEADSRVDKLMQD